MAIITLNNNSLSSVTSLPAAISTGKVLQVVSSTKTDTFTTTSTSLVDIPSLSVSVTPSSTSNKVFIIGNLSNNTNSGRVITFQLVRNTTNIANNASSGNFSGTVSEYINANTNDTITNSSFSFLDSPSTTSATTYKIQMMINVGDNTAYINTRPNGDAFQISTITAYEIAG